MSDKEASGDEHEQVVEKDDVEQDVDEVDPVEDGGEEEEEEGSHIDEEEDLIDDKDDEDIVDDREEEYETPISALPPQIFLQEESQVEVSASPAFQVLDDLFQEGRLTGTKVALLKAKYSELHETLKNSRINEARLLKDAKSQTTQLEDYKAEIGKGDLFPEGSNTEVSKLRQQLLKYHNDLSEAEDRQSQLEYKIECLQQEKVLVERECSRLPKQGEVEKQIKDLHSSCDELKKEKAQRQIEARNLREDLDTKQQQYHMENKEFEILKEKLDKCKAELVNVNSVPAQVAKEADKLMRQKNEKQNQKKKLDIEYNDYMNQLKQLEISKTALGDDKFDIEDDLRKQKQALAEKEREYDYKMKEFESMKEREAQVLGDRATLDVSLRHIHMEKKSLHDILSRKNREKDKDLRNLKKLELQFRNAEDSLSHTQSVYEKIKSHVDGMPKDDGSLLKKREELQKEVEQTKRALAQQNSLTAVEHVKLEASAAEEQNLLYEQSDLRIEVVELTRLAAIKADEREQKARDFMRAEMRYHRAIEDLKTKQLQIQDHQKKFQEMQIKLKEFAKLYDIIKNERNKCVNLIQTSTQKAAEMREKIKILANEIEILRTAVALKDKQLQKQRLKHMNGIVLRDSLRNEVAKQHRIEEEMREKREQQKMDIAKLNLMINQAEEQMMKLRKRYETAVQHRNKRGIDLIERNEEVCIFYEKVNIQDQMVRNGNVELESREEEIRFLKIQLAEENRSIDLLKRNMPNKRNQDRELVTLQIQLSQCQDRLMELERDLENPQIQDRVRFLEGQDLTPGQLQTRLQELEARMAEKEEQLLEKDLVYEQVTRIADRVKTKAESGKDDTLLLAKKVNDLQSKIKDVTRKMMSLVSELSMNQANALKLQQELREKEDILEQAYIRMEKGEPPSEETEQDWQKLLRDVVKRRQEAELRHLIEGEEEQYQIAGGITTTAEPRPNAYIPDDDSELPIPRPYGKHAPFKPSDCGSNMRHIRKPVPKPIEI